MVDRKIVELLMGGTGVNAIARQLKVSKRRIRALRESAWEYGYLERDGRPGTMKPPPYPEAVFPDPVDGRSLRVSDTTKDLAPHAEWIRERLEAGWHAVTVHEELPVAGIGRSSFYRYLEREGLTRLGESYRVVPEIVHRPGEALLLDWGKLRDVAELTTGKKRTLWMFVGVLGFSRFMMVRLVWTMDTATTLEALEGMFRAMKGVPFKVTIDNPKCVALEASDYEPVLNPVVERFAAYYGVVVECLPPGDPQKKGKVERPMSYCRRLYEAHGDVWSGIEESQAYLDRKLEVANQRRHGTTQRQPIRMFEEEAKALKPLPATAYELEQFHEGIVRQDGHVRFGNKYYSVDERYRGKAVVVLGGTRQVSIYHKGKLLEVHERLTDPFRSKSTKEAHLKPWERAMQDDSVYRRRAQGLGPNVDRMIQEILGQGQGFIDTRKVWGILSLDKRYSAERIDAACRRALALGQSGYRAVKRFLEWEDGPMVIPMPAPVEAASPRAPHKHARPLSVYRDVVNLFAKEVQT
jgi:transposase